MDSIIIKIIVNIQKKTVLYYGRFVSPNPRIKKSTEPGWLLEKYCIQN